MGLDKEGVGIIMCESGLESKYRALGHGQTILESSLHTNLAEHLNSEIGLGTIKNMESAKEWMRHSFMFRRFTQNPHRYMSKEQTWKGGLDNMISKSIEDLRDAELLTLVEGGFGELRSTEFGEIMSKVRIKAWSFDFGSFQDNSSTLGRPRYSNLALFIHHADSKPKMASIMKLPVKATVRDMVRACRGQRFMLLSLHS